MKTGPNQQNTNASPPTRDTLTIDNIPIKQVSSKRYLGSLFTAQFDGGITNIKQRIAMARACVDVELRNIVNNPYINWKEKLHFYRTDILALLLHGIEFWILTPKIIKLLERFQRNTLLRLLQRNWRDRITSVDLYDWMRTRKFNIYPIEITIRERQLRYFSNLLSHGIQLRNQLQPVTDLASILYWSDISPPNRKTDVEYPHITNMRAALSLLKIPIPTANQEFRNKDPWEKFLKNQQLVAYTDWKVQQLRNRDLRKANQRHVPDVPVLIGSNGRQPQRPPRPLPG